MKAKGQILIIVVFVLIATISQELGNQKTNEVISKFSSPQDLAAGSYTVEIFINDKSRGTRKFYV
ncbi:MAG TPA: hypothetical protein VN476_09065 [Pyrinomonadaceae bacterium]|nr:hypothetical protein [Pyrinomonadaceae bacterium]